MPGIRTITPPAGGLGDASVISEEPSASSHHRLPPSLRWRRWQPLHERYRRCASHPFRSTGPWWPVRPGGSTKWRPSHEPRTSRATPLRAATAPRTHTSGRRRIRKDRTSAAGHGFRRGPPASSQVASWRLHRTGQPVSRLITDSGLTHCLWQETSTPPIASDAARACRP